MEIALILQELGLPKLPSLLHQGEPLAFDWIATEARVQRNLHYDVLIEFGVTFDLKDSNQSRLLIQFNPTQKL